MYEIVYEQSEKNRKGIDKLTGGIMPADTRVTVFKSPGKVAYVNSVLVVGAAKRGSDKRFYYWRSYSSAGFRLSSAGNIVPYSCTRRWDAKLGTPWVHKMPLSPFTWLEVGDSADVVAFRQAVSDEFNVFSLDDIYPMANKYGISKYLGIPNNLKMPFRESDWEAYTTKVFGKKRTNQRIIAAVQKSDPYFVSYTHQFRGLVDDKLLLSVMEDNVVDESMEEFLSHTPNLRTFLLNTDQKTRDSLVKTKIDLRHLRRVRAFSKYNKAMQIDYTRYNKMWFRGVMGV